MKEIPELRLFRSNRFMVYAALFAVIWLSPNTYYVFHSFCVFLSPYREIASGGAALIVAFFIMLFTLRKNEKVAGYFSMFEISISAYYYVSTIGIDWGLLPALSFTLMLPYAVYKSTTEIDRDLSSNKLVSKEELEKFMDKNPNKRPTQYWT